MALLATVFTESLQTLVRISHRALFIYYSMHLVEYVILYQPVLSQVMQQLFLISGKLLVQITFL